MVLYFGWFVSVTIFGIAFLGPSHMGSMDYVYNPTDAAMFNAFAPFGWCALFAWVILINHTGNANGKH